MNTTATTATTTEGAPVNTIARHTALANLRDAIQHEHRIAYRAALREVAHFATGDESRAVKAAIQTEHYTRPNRRPSSLASPAIRDLAGLPELPEAYDMDYLLSHI